jgi:hypothetical protein
MDFTLTTYKKLLNSLLTRGFSFITFAQYMELKTESENNPSQPFSNLKPRTPNAEPPTHQQINKEQINNFESLNPESLNLIILRHDVEDRYLNALRMAQIEHKMGIMGSYYFRLFPVADNDRIISQIAALGHEVGYHYDDLSVCKGNHEAALKRFQKNLAHLRQFAPVSTITMEGAPLSKYDNRDLWKQPLTPQLLESLNLESSNPQQINKFYPERWLPSGVEASRRATNQPANKITSQQANISTNPMSTVHYSLFSITAEPYFDLDFNQFFYLTDTGRCWDGWNVSVRDKVPQQEEWVKQGLVFHSTEQIIRAANEGRLPDKIMMTFHPQRWTDNHVFWLKELVLQRLKNVVKRGLVRF